MAVASNAPFSEWGQTFTDARLAAAVVDRLTFRAHILETGAEFIGYGSVASRKPVLTITVGQMGSFSRYGGL